MNRINKMKHRIVTGILQIRFTASHLRHLDVTQVVNVGTFDCATKIYNISKEKVQTVKVKQKTRKKDRQQI